MPRRFLKPALGLFLGALALVPRVNVPRAHTLPVSYLTVASDSEQWHLEWVLNPFELAFFSELDRNGDSQVSSEELRLQEQAAVQRLLEALRIRADGKPLPAETAGLIPQLDGHHLAFRAHYRPPVRAREIELESRASALLGGSHVIQARVAWQNDFQTAQLDFQNTTLRLKGPAADESGAAGSSREGAAHSFTLLPLAILLPALVLAIVFAARKDSCPAASLEPPAGRR